MLRKYSGILNLPVICADSGRKAGNVADMVFSPASREVKALLLDDRGIMPRKRVVYIDELLELGDDAAIINGMKSVLTMGRSEFAKVFGSRYSPVGLRVFSRNGGEIGIVKDVLFDVQTGRIEGLEISDGIFQDIMQGRKILPLLGKAEFGQEFAVVEKEAVKEMKGTGGGIRGKFYYVNLII